MTIEHAIPLVAEVSMMLIMIGVALLSTFADVFYLLRKPLLSATALFSIAFVPVAAHLTGLAYDRQVDVSPLTVTRIVATSMLLPLLAGVSVRRLAPALADRVAAPLSTAGALLLIIAFVPVLFGAPSRR
jgi:hypothetical protein